MFCGTVHCNVFQICEYHVYVQYGHVCSLFCFRLDDTMNTSKRLFTILAKLNSKVSLTINKCQTKLALFSIERQYRYVVLI